MDNQGLFLFLFFGGLVVVGFLCFAIVEIIGFIYKVKDKMFRKKYPEFFALLDDVHDFGCEVCRRHNATVPKLIKEIDAIEAELKYLPKWQVEIKNKKLEELRQELYEAKLSSKADDEELEAKRKVVREYIEKNNLTFAKKWGW
jgi:ABC-type phosphate transport system auxiliary subunit